MICDKSFSVDRGGVRLDAAVLAAFPSSTRAFVRDAIAAGGIEVFSGSARIGGTTKGLKLRGGETIHVRELLEAADNLVAPCGKCPDPIFEDAALLAFDKPSGMPVQPLSCRETGTLANAVTARFPECRALGDAPLMAGAIHRIDADTSGLVLVARTAEAFANLRAQFAAQKVEKTYLALVEGNVAVGGTLENDLAHDPTLPFCKMIDARANRLTNAQRAGLRPMHAVTSFAPIAHTCAGEEELTLLEVKIFTGVTHQIRAQLAMAGMHIVNDRLYGAFAVEDMSGHRLHALAAKFSHPTSGDAAEIRTPYPAWAKL